MQGEDFIFAMQIERLVIYYNMLLIIFFTFKVGKSIAFKINISQGYCLPTQFQKVTIMFNIFMMFSIYTMFKMSQ